MTADAGSHAPRDVDKMLFVVCSNGELSSVRELVESQDADPCFQDPDSGMSVLMVAAGMGHTSVVQYLLGEGAPWNAVDRCYLCAGDHAANNGHQECIDVLLNHAVMCELLLSSTDDTSESVQCQSVGLDGEHPIRTSDEPPRSSLNATYLSSRLEYSGDGTRLVDKSTDLAVMMDWERPLMARHAAWICHAMPGNEIATSLPSLRVLNIGFGMGIVDGEIQAYKPRSHVISEAHPEVLSRMRSDGWFEKPGVQVVEGRWQDVVQTLAQEISCGKIEPFDGIFFDTYAEDDRDLRQFHSWLPNLLRKSLSGEPLTRYSFYNGVCPDNVFFHGVACETIRLHLKRHGLTCNFEPIKVDVADPKLWGGLTRRYWYFDTYFLPKCTF